jgi:peptidoglycan/xylan/chitin deacetylase (PgdA/CDA1 family)
MSGLPILTYHALDASGGVLATDPSWFAETLAALAEAGFRCVDLADWVAAGRPPVGRGFALAFDDGLRSIARAADLLARHRFTATAFLVTGRMGLDNGWPGQPSWVPRSPLLDRSDLPSLRAAGFRFASHTRTHPRLDRLTTGDVEDELRGSRDDIEAMTGAPCRLLAYPYGLAPARARRLVARHFAAAFGTRLAYATPDEGVTCMSRIDAYYLRSSRALGHLLAGTWPRRLALRRAFRAAKAGFSSAPFPRRVPPRPVPSPQGGEG